MKKGDSNWNRYAKKDTNGLFDGNFKSQKFDTDPLKEERRRKKTKDWLEYADEEEDIEDED